MDLSQAMDEAEAQAVEFLKKKDAEKHALSIGDEQLSMILGGRVKNLDGLVEDRSGDTEALLVLIHKEVADASVIMREKIVECVMRELAHGEMRQLAQDGKPETEAESESQNKKKGGGQIDSR